MTLTPLLKELKEKAIRIEKDPIGEFYCNPRSILFLIQAIEEMKEALENLVKSEVVRSAQYITYSEAYLNAQECLDKLAAMQSEGEK